MTTYYVATDGSDSNDGSQRSPWRSLGAASGAVSPGDTVVVRDGTYDYTTAQRLTGPDATQSNPITVRAADGATPVISFGGSSGGGWSADGEGGIHLWGANWVIDGLEVRDSPFYGIYVGSGGSGSTIRNCTAHGNHLVGIGGLDATGLTVENCVAHDNYGSTSGGGDSDGFAFSGGDDAVVRSCTAHSNGDDGFDFWDATGVLVDQCKSYNNGRDGGDGNGYKMGGGDSSGDNTVQRSAAWKNGATGFTYNAADTVYFYNNTSWDNDRGFYAGNGSELVNNVSFADGTARSTSNTVEETNTWDLGIDDPRFESTDPASDAFLELSSNSPAVDAGTDVGLEYSGSAPDLGCKESSDATSSEPSTDGGAALYYHDGSDWRQVSMKYHDGSGFA